MSDILDQDLRAACERALAHGWTLEPSPTVPGVVVLTLRDGTELRGPAHTLLEVLRGLPEAIRA